MKTELSAGAVILKKIKNMWHVLCIRDMNNHLTFPKGLVEKQEEAKDAALREANEETGISHLLFQAPLSDVTYFYTRNNETIHKTVHYFLFTYEGEEKLKPQKEEGISEIVWLPIKKAIDEVGYKKSNVPVLKKAKAYMAL